MRFALPYANHFPAQTVKFRCLRLNGVEHRDTTYGAHLQQHVDDTLEFQKHRFSFKCEVELNESNYNDNSVNNNINNGDIHNSNSNNKATMTKT